MIDENKVQKFNQLLIDKKLTIVCAESVTAGLLASTIASISGASSILKGSIVTYNRELKTDILKVNPEIIAQYSAESTQTTVEMVKGLLILFPNTNIHVGVTGIASPGNPEYPISGEVGDIYIAINYQQESVQSKLSVFELKIDQSDRNKIRENAVTLILEKITAIISE